MFFIGQVVGSLFIPRMMDVYGRRWPFFICVVLQFVVYVASLLATNIHTHIAMQFFMGVVYVGRYNGGFVTICEYYHGKWKNIVCTIVMVLDSGVGIIIPYYFKSISKNWIWL